MGGMTAKSATVLGLVMVLVGCGSPDPYERIDVRVLNECGETRMIQVLTGAGPDFLMTEPYWLPDTGWDEVIPAIPVVDGELWFRVLKVRGGPDHFDVAPGDLEPTEPPTFVLQGEYCG